MKNIKKESKKRLEKKELYINSTYNKSKCYFYRKKVSDMYIHPFICGIIATILAELSGIIVYAIYDYNTNK